MSITGMEQQLQLLKVQHILALQGGNTQRAVELQQQIDSLFQTIWDATMDQLSNMAVNYE